MNTDEKIDVLQSLLNLEMEKRKFEELSAACNHGEDYELVKKGHYDRIIIGLEAVATEIMITINM